MNNKNAIDLLSIKMLYIDDDCCVDNILSDIKCIKNIDERGSDGRTLLMHAAVYGCYKIAEYLIGSSANINAKDNIGYTALHAAVSSNNQAIVELLLNNNAQINAVDMYGNNPLSLASHLDVELIELLIEYGADPFLKNNFGVCPFDRFQAYPNTQRIMKNKRDDDVI